MTSLALAWIGDAGAIGSAASDLPARLGVAPAIAERATRELAARGALVAAGSSWVAAGVLPDLRTALLRAIDAAHAADPLAGGVPRHRCGAWPGVAGARRSWI